MEPEQNQLVQLFLEGCDRLSDIDYDDPKLAEFYAISPQQLASEATEGLWSNMIRYFDRLAPHEGIGGTHQPIYTFFTMENNNLIVQEDSLNPNAFNEDNETIVRLLPRLIKPALKYSNENTEDDYI